jgi:hypothetical protein
VSSRLQAPTLDFGVDVCLREFSGRWLAVAEISGEGEIGLGGSTSETLSASPASLGDGAGQAPLADPQPFEVSGQVRPFQ